ncbi:MAG TPA: hypothetical protein VE172_01340 [Stackebrandtia sp.]|jgi:hypothetical protein|uniref:hypothetical protein n=1 Tax=Stackebrandtia sp. TaxID=2023065 RepID=UPI002D419A0D|nr:hypothetical protein [Stackebrandtia sp.]HZE37431.1 hypothetical protein [Stackebrandtia sp.]
MTQRTRTIVGAAIGVAAAGWWVVVMAVQAAAEPIAYAENNTYWYRDARWLALLALAVALVWTFRGDRVVSWAAVGGFVGSVGLDVLVDRLNAMGLCAVIAAWLGGWVLGMRRPINPRTRPLLLAASLAAAGAV